MAIDRIKKVTIVSPGTSPARLLRLIFNLGVMEVIDVGEPPKDAEGLLQRAETTTEEADEKLRKIDLILNLLDVFAPAPQGFFEGLTPLPLVVDQHEIDDAIQKFDLEEHFTAAKDLDEVYRRADRLIGEIKTHISELTPLESLPYRIGDFSKPARTCLVLGDVSAKVLASLDPSADPWSRVAWELVRPGEYYRKGGPPEEPAPLEAQAKREQTVRVLFALLKEDEEVVRKALKELGFEETVLPSLPGKVRDRIRQLKADLAEYEERVAKVAAEVQRLAVWRRTLLILKAVWASTRSRRLAAAQGLRGKWLHVVSGYVCVRDLPKLEAALRHEFPSSMLVVDDPPPGEDVPVSLSPPRVARPLRLLVEMFGLPPYQGFDPSLFMVFNFYLFFGICFSDVGYGLLLVLASAYLARKTRCYHGVNMLARMLFFGGCTTIVCGALLGSWFGDLYKPEYLGEGNVLHWVQQRLVVLDPVAKTVNALVIALFIGIFNQFYGIALKMYGALRQKDWMTAVCDGLFWLIALPGFVIIISALFVEVPPSLFRTGLGLFAAGSVALALTQGRHVKNPVGRLLTGIVSLYGILGSYGYTAFIGDTLSYCRLLALGLTTSIVAQSVNMLADMVRGAPFIGAVLFLAILIIGHAFNFLISLLGAFIHSMRLIFVEFFGRFYEGGARPFQPLGFDSPMCVMRKPAGGA